MEQGQKVRNSNIELLRIFAMILIIAYHSMRRGYGNWGQPVPVYLTGIVLGSWGLMADYLFVIISAWFMVDQKFKVKHIIGIVVQVFCYVLFFSLWYLIIHLQQGNPIEILADFIYYETDELLTPLWAKDYGFVTAYFFLYLLMPFLNQCIKKSTDAILRKVLLIFSFVPIYTVFQATDSTIHNVICFAYAYVLVGYLKRSKDHFFNKNARKGFVLCTTFIIVVKVASLLIDTVPRGIFGIVISKILSVLSATGNGSGIWLVDALFLFFFVVEKKESYHPYINAVSSCVLGIYLFQENSLCNIINYVFKKMEEIGWLTLNALFPIKYISVVLLIFAMGFLIELLRKYVIQKPIMKLVDSHQESLAKIDRWFDI